MQTLIAIIKDAYIAADAIVSALRGGRRQEAKAVVRCWVAMTRARLNVDWLLTKGRARRVVVNVSACIARTIGVA
ncbi:MAG: hypothetical protein GC162_19595 [Planctomycetes bacterium]|nr:hypothetical protein [Planctomycetota bacterium]